MSEALNLPHSIRVENNTSAASTPWNERAVEGRGRDGVQELRLIRDVLIRIAVCVVPPMACLAVGRPEIGGKLFFLTLLVLLARRWWLRDGLGAVSVIVGTIPALMIFRDFFFFSSVVLILGFGVALWYLESVNEFSRLWSDLKFKGLFLLCLLYWLVSYLLTGQYSSNLRIMELTLAVASIYLLAGHLEYLATALLGIGISIISMGMAFLPYGDRLGKGEVGDYDLGNPASFGIPLALILTLAIADNGKWLLLEKHLSWRVAFGLAAGAFLVLSTSRGSWLIVLVNMVALFLIDRRQRRLLLGMAAVMSLVVVLLLASSRGEVVERFFDKTFSSESTLKSSTSGRSDQWELFPKVFSDSPIWGFGPGTGADVYARYSIARYLFLGGYRLAWHSLYLQVGVEAGIIGLISLALILIPLAVQGWRTMYLAGDAVPLLGTLGFLMIALSVSGMDAASGVFLGLGFLRVKLCANTEFAGLPRVGGCILQPLTRDQVIANFWQFHAFEAESPDGPWEEREWLADLPDKWRLSWVLLKNWEPVGFLIASRKGEALHVHRLAVTQSEQRKGFGTLLMAAAAFRALEHRCPLITLEANSASHGAIAFYRHLSFKVVEQERDHLLMGAESQQVFDLA